MSNVQEVEDEAGDGDTTRSGDLEVSGHLQEKHTSSRRNEGPSLMPNLVA